MIIVYHNFKIFSNPEYRRNLDAAMKSNQEIIVERLDLQPVAQINESPQSLAEIHNALDRAYGLTQNDRVLWWNKSDIIRIGTSEHRSSSVGDVIEIDDQFWLIADLGFRRCEVK